MGKLSDASYHAKAPRHNARPIGLHLAWIAWAVLGIDTVVESMRGESLRRAEWDQRRYEREWTITLEEFIGELKKSNKSDADGCERL